MTTSRVPSNHRRFCCTASRKPVEPCSPRGRVVVVGGGGGWGGGRWGQGAGAWTSGPYLDTSGPERRADDPPRQPLRRGGTRHDVQARARIDARCPASPPSRSPPPPPPGRRCCRAGRCPPPCSPPAARAERTQRPAQGLRAGQGGWGSGRSRSPPRHASRRAHVRLCLLACTRGCKRRAARVRACVHAGGPLHARARPPLLSVVPRPYSQPSSLCMSKGSYFHPSSIAGCTS